MLNLYQHPIEFKKGSPDSNRVIVVDFATKAERHEVARRRVALRILAAALINRRRVACSTVSTHITAMLNLFQHPIEFKKGSPDSNRVIIVDFATKAERHKVEPGNAADHSSCSPLALDSRPVPCRHLRIW